MTDTYETASYGDENPCWGDLLPDFGEVVEADYDDDDLHDEGTCEYCGSEPWRWPSGEPHVDPFGGKITCRSCWDQIIDGETEQP